MKVVIVGNHAAGLSAAQTLRAGDRSCEIVMISKEDVPPYSRSLISYLVSGQKEIEGILYKPREFYRDNEIQTQFGAEVVGIQKGEREVVLAGGEKVKYDALILANGGTPSLPRIPGIRNRGVFSFRNLADARDIVDYCREGVESVAILGGGLVGLKAAEGLNNLGKKVVVAASSPNVLSQIVGKVEGEIFEEHLREKGIEILLNASPTAILGEGQVQGVELEDGRKVPCQLAISAKGVRANTALAKDAGIETQYGVIVDERCRTSALDIYAAGDVTQSVDTVRNETWTNALWPHAVEEGRVAAENVLGKGSVLQSRTSMNAIKIYGLSMISCGLTGSRDDVEGGEEFSFKGPGRFQSRRFILKDNRLVGYALVGNVNHAGALTSLVRKGIDVAKAKDRIFAGRYDFATLVALIEENRRQFHEPEYDEALGLRAGRSH